MAYGPNKDDVAIRVWDRNTARYMDDAIPGAWDAETEFMEANRLVYFEGTGGLVDWTVSTSGFNHGDYSMSTAGCGTQ